MIETLIWNDNISLNNIGKFENAIEALVATSLTSIILNLETVSYMNSRALGIIANAVKVAENMNKKLVIINNQITVKEIFDIVNFHSIVQVFENVNEAENYLYEQLSKTRKKVV